MNQQGFSAERYALNLSRWFTPRNALALLGLLIWGGVLTPAWGQVNPNPVAHYRFDETGGTTAADSAGSNPGTINSATLGQQGMVGTAYSFNGTFNYVTVPHSSTIDPTGAWTLSAFVRLAATPTAKMIIMDKYNEAPGYGNYRMQISSTGVLEGLVYSGYSVAYCRGATVLVPGTGTDNWYHVAVTFDSTANQIRCYVNGALDNGTGSLNPTDTTIDPPASSVDLKIGVRSAITNYYFNGLIDEVKIFSVALTAPQVCADALRTWNGSSCVVGGGGSPPNAPVGVSAADVTGDQGGAVSVTWTPSSSSGVTEQRVYRGTASGGPYSLVTTITNNTTTSYTNTGLTNGTTYYYVVLAWNGSAESANSNQASAVPVDNIAPAAPTNLSATAGNAQVVLSWTVSLSGDVTQQRLYRGTVSGGPYPDQLTPINNNTTASFTDTGVSNGTTYYYVIRAFDGTQESGNSTQSPGVTPSAGGGGSSQWTTSGNDIYNTNTAGNVGIGTTTPQSGMRLDVAGPAIFGSGAAAPTELVRGKLSGTADLLMREAATDVVTLGSSAPNDQLALNISSGNVGIGTTNPGRTLSIGQNTAGNNTDYALEILRHGTSETTGTYTPNVPALLINDLSGDGPSSLASVGLLDVRAPRIADTDPNAANALLLRVTNDSGSALVIDGRRNVGIGTISPSAKLEVAGNIRMPGRWIVANSGVWGGDTFELHTSGWDGSSNGNYAGIAGGHAYFYGGLQSGGPSGGEAASGELYVSGRSMLLGNVGVGMVPTGAYRLEVQGNANFNGTVTGTNIIANYQDVAEWVPAPIPMPAGTVVVLDTEQNNQVIASSHPYDTKVAGVISSMPGLLLGIEGEGKVKVATTGRVKVKVDASKGPIKVGDLLVTSNKPGIAMRSEPIEIQGRLIHSPGTIIGKALEPLASGQGEILVLLSLQ